MDAAVLDTSQKLLHSVVVVHWVDIDALKTILQTLKGGYDDNRDRLYPNHFEMRL